MEKNNIELDIDKQMWLAKQKELSEYEIIQRRKKRNMYWVWKKILILITIIIIVIMIYWEDIVKWVQMIRN